MSKKTENKTDKKQKQSKPEFTILSDDDVKEVQSVGRAIEKSDSTNRPKIVAILEANKEHHATIGAEIQKAARQAKLENAPQTLKNWVYIWRSENGLSAAKDEDNKGGQENPAGKETAEHLDDDASGFENTDDAADGIAMGAGPFIRNQYGKADGKAVVFAEGQGKLEGVTGAAAVNKIANLKKQEWCLRNGSVATLAYSRWLAAQAAKVAKEIKALEGSPLTAKEKADAKKAAKPAKAKGNRNTKTEAVTA